MAIYINQNKKIKNIYANVNGERKSMSSAWVNRDGVPAKVFQINNDKPDTNYDIAPVGAHTNWNYTLDDSYNQITLNYYIGSETDVVVYARYKVNGRIYTTQIKSNTEEDSNYMFDGCKNIQTILFSHNIDTGSVTNMSSMFSNCNKLISLDISGFDTSNVTNMEFMFFGCRALTSVDVSNFNTSNVVNMAGMFYRCESLTSLDLSSFNTRKVKFMGQMFLACSSLTNLNLSGFHTSNVEYMNQMFDSCNSLPILDLRSFDTHKVVQMNHMFYNCRTLKKIYVASYGWSTSQASIVTDMFTNCGTPAVTYA